MQRILLIQTAFIGDVVLATGILEKLHDTFPDVHIDILVRKGNEPLFDRHPFIHQVLVWDKKKSKYLHLLRVLRQIRSHRYDVVINVQRYAATGFLTAFSGARRTIGFDKNPFHLLFTDVIRHSFGNTDHPMHEIERNHLLIRSFTDTHAGKPTLYPSAKDEKEVESWKQQPYICIAPASVWFTKQFPPDQWVSFMDTVSQDYSIYLLGAPGDRQLCEQMASVSVHPRTINLAGKLDFLQSAALMRTAVMNYVNDSAPMHFASAVNAPVTAVYCSTLPSFGYGPLSDNSHIVELQEPLYCRPCGIHGRSACPEQHFKCAKCITTRQLQDCLPS